MIDLLLRDFKYHRVLSVSAPALFAGFALIMLFMLSMSAFAQSSIHEQKLHHGKQQTLSKNLQFIRLPADQSLTLEQIMTVDDRRWQPIEGKNPSFGLSDDLFWFTTRLYSREDFSAILEMDRPYIDIVDIYLVDQQGNIVSYQLGDFRQHSDQLAGSTNPQIPVEFGADQYYQFYMMVNTQGKTVMFQLDLWQPKAAVRNSNRWLAYYGGIFGAATIIALYNLFVGLSVRQSSYFYYSAFAFLMSFSIVNIQGYSYTVIEDLNGPLHNLITSIISPISYILVSIFLFKFLSIKQHFPRIKWIFYYFIASSLMVVFIATDLYKAFIIFHVFNAVMFFPVCFSIALYAWYKNVECARFVVVAWGVFAPIFCWYFLMVIGVVDYYPWVTHLLGVGACSEMVLLAMALADKLNVAKNNEDKILVLQEKTIDDQRRLIESQSQKIQAEQEQKSAQREAQKARLAADNALIESKAKSDFLATMSHEIRTPMNGVMGMAELLQQTELDEVQQRFVKTINDSGHALLTVINDILDYSKIEANKMDLEVVDFDLEAMVDSCLDIFSLHCIDNNLQLMACLSPGVPQAMRGDPTRIRQVILNLLANAIKFSECGDITLKVAAVRSQDSANDTVARERLAIRFEISDSGIGIDADQQQTLFESFTQADGSTTRRFGGTGLGLTISKQLVELMQGQIGVDSEVGKGSTFFFEIPYLSATDQSVITTPEYSQLLAGKTILIVDDNVNFREFSALSCRSWGLEVLQAASGEQALDLIGRASNAIDLLLIDVILPDTNGYRLYQKIEQALPGSAMPKTVFVSAMQRDHSALETIKDGGQPAPFLEKPIASGRLRQTLAELLGQQAELSAQQSLDEPMLPDLGALSVLVADDNTVNRLVISGQLKKMNIEAVFVEDGRQALEAVTNAEFDLILMDCEMPELDGHQATRAIRKLTLDRQPTIIALTAMLTEQVEREVMESGMDGFLSKPIGLQKLAESLQMFCGSQLLGSVN